MVKMKNNKLIVEKFGYNPLDLLKRGSNVNVPDGRSSFEDTLKVIKEFGVELLVPFLRSGDIITTGKALHVFSELGSNNRHELIDEVLTFLEHPDENIRWYTIDGLLAYAEKVPKKYVAIVLGNVDDRSARIRIKTIQFISSLSPSKIKSAQELLLSTDSYKQHIKGLKILENEEDTQNLIDQFSDDEKVYSSYILAKVIKDTKSGGAFEINDDQIINEEIAYVQKWLNLKKTINLRSLSSKGQGCNN